MGRNNYLINGSTLFHAYIWRGPDATTQQPSHWEFQGTFNLGQLADRIANINADPWLFQHAGNDETREAHEMHAAGAAGFDVNEANRLSVLIQSIGERVNAAIANFSHGESYDPVAKHMFLGKLWKDVFMDIRAIVDQAVVQIGPALDALTRDASKGATQRAWQLNQQIAALPISWNPGMDHGDNANEPSVRRAASLAAQIQGIYSGALASL